MATRRPTDVMQRTEGEGDQPTHTHRPQTHAHDHYHISHHHRGDLPIGEWEHRTYWHTHKHNHNELAHSHDYDRAGEENEHGKEAHVHDRTPWRRSFRVPRRSTRSWRTAADTQAAATALHRAPCQPAWDPVQFGGGRTLWSPPSQEGAASRCVCRAWRRRRCARASR